MNEEKSQISATLKEGYWVKIGSDSYAVHQILSVSVTEPPEEEGFFQIIWPVVGLGLGILGGAQTGSLIVGIVLSLLLILLPLALMLHFQEAEKKRLGFPRNVTIDLGKTVPRVVAEGIPKQDAERLQSEIEAIIADAAKSEAGRTKAAEAG